jgi:predicted extracellular nuclease
MKSFWKIVYMSVFVVHFAWSDDARSLKIAFWNVENLFDLIDDPTINDNEFSIGGKKNVTQEIYDLKLVHSAEVLADLDADILGICEVENRFMMEELNKAFTGRNYKIIHYDSPDRRGIDCALFYDESKFIILESKQIKNTLSSGKPTRDIVYVKGQFGGEILHVFVNHWPSNYGGREQAIPKRAETARFVREKVEKILNGDPKAEILLMGDFNEGPNEQNIQYLAKDILITLMEPFIGKKGVGTYVYRGQDSLLDQFIASGGLLDDKGLKIEDNAVSILDLPKYRQQRGKYKHYPFRFWAGEKLLGGYSDHLAISVEINLIQ